MKEDLLSTNVKNLPEWKKMQNNRDYLFDNYKVFLIFLVVVGHFIGPSVGCNEFLRILKWIIVSFHMPAIIFISGYFSKRNLPVLTIIQRLAVPYLTYEIIYYLWYTFVTHKETSLALLKPKFTLWYLLALFMWRIITPYVKKFPYHMVLAILAGFLIGFSNMEDNFLTIPRAVVYFPFYLAGTSFDRELLNKWRNSRKAVTLAILVILMIALALTFVGFQKIAPMQVFYGRYNYVSMKQGMTEGIVWRILLYVIGFLMTFSFMILIPEKKLPVSYMGTRTMAIYLFHGLTYTYLEQCTKLLNNIYNPFSTLLLLILCAVITWFFSLRPFTLFTNLFSNIPVLSSKKGTAS